MRTKFKWSYSLIFLIITTLAWSQNKNISGTVTDDKGKPISNVLVTVEETGTITTTDNLGTYSIEATEGQTLVFDNNGTVTRQTVGTSNAVSIQLAVSQQQLEEVVVTALGITREKKSLGYSSQQVKAEDLDRVPTQNFSSNLAGKVSGLQIKSGTNFGGSVDVVLRGYKSIDGNNQPLFIVDGVPLLNNNNNSSRQARSGRTGFDYGNTISDINPNDIESVNVLKGAASTALYGSRGQNGAIIITTKKGKAQKGIGIEFSSSITTGYFDKSTFPTYQTEYGQGYLGETFGKYLEKDRVPTGHDASYGPKYDDDLVWQYTSVIPGSPTFGELTPWKVAKNGPSTFFKNSFSHKNDIAFKGGNEKSNFRISYGNLNSTDILPNSKLNRNTLTGNSSFKLTDNLEATLGATYVNQHTIGRNSTGYNDNIMSNFRQWWATNVDLQDQKAFYFNSNKNYTWNIKSINNKNLVPQYWDNPYFQRYKNYSEDDRDRFAGNISLNYDINNHISLLARVGTDGYTHKIEERRALGSIPSALELNTNVNGPQPSGYAVKNIKRRETNYDLIGTFKTSITEKLLFTGISGININNQSREQTILSTSGGLLIPELYTVSNSSSAAAPVQTIDINKRIIGIYGQAAFAIDDTYFIEGTLRRDESSALPDDNNSYWYYSGSASILFSKWLNLNFLDFGKLRGSYAEVGSDTDPDQLLNRYFVENPFTSPLYYYNILAKNDKLKPQRSKQYEVGINLQMFKRRIGIDVAWFQNDAFDQILALPVSSTTGFFNKVQNAGNLRTTGLEISLNTTPIKTQDIRWDLDINWSNPITKVTKLSKDVENITLGSFQGGISINASIDDKYGTIKGSDYIYAPDGQKVITISNSATTGSYLVTTDNDHVIGNMQSDWYGSVTNKLSYKNISLSFQIDWKQGGNVFSLDQYYGYGTGLYPDSVGNNDLGNPVRDGVYTYDVDGIITGQVGPPSSLGGVVLPGVNLNSDGTYTTNTTRLDKYKSSQVLGTDPPASAFIYDASFVKLREIAITYNLPSRFFENSFVKGASFSAIGNNLWIIKKYLPYADPEAGLSSGNVQGYQSGPMPAVKYISFNFKINF